MLITAALLFVPVLYRLLACLLWRACMPRPSDGIIGMVSCAASWVRGWRCYARPERRSHRLRLH